VLLALALADNPARSIHRLGGCVAITNHRDGGSNRFLQAAIGASFCGILLNGCTIGASTNVDLTCIQVSGTFSLGLNQCKVFGQISMTEPAAGASLTMNGTGVLGTTAFHNVSGSLSYSVLGCQQLSGSGFTVAGQFPNRAFPSLISP
jgi:hypothetical protein